jgi:hypothetical protein
LTWTEGFLRSITLCAAIAALVPACGTDVTDDLGTANDTTAGTGTPGDRAAALDACSTVAAGAPWWNQGFPDQARRFHVELDATPSTVGLDAVIGLSDGAATDFARLAAIVRFNASGTIDARDGDTYRATSSIPYSAGQAIHVRIDLDVRTHRYSVFLRFTPDSSYFEIAHDFAFRTEQSGVMRLNNVGSKIDGASGSVSICGISVVADATTADGCVVASAGDGFVTQPVRDATVVGTVTFQATPSDPAIDGVIGWSAGAPSRFSDLAAAVRFSPNGVIDVRDGDTYRADFNRTYTARASFLRMTADLTSHTYSVFDGMSFASELARQYRFRPSPVAVTHLDHTSVIVDSPTGSVKLCSLQSVASQGVTFSREGAYAVAPLPGDASLISNGMTTQRLDAGGRTVAQLADGGELAVDALGNVFIASISNATSDGATLSIRKYDPGFAPLWTTSLNVNIGSQIQAFATDAAGEVLVGFALPSARALTAFRFSASGAFVSEMLTTGDAIGFDGDQALVAWNDSGTLRITRYRPDGGPAWSRGFTGSAAITQITADPNHEVLFGGELGSSIDFGGGALPLASNPDSSVNGFFVLLSPAGDHLMSRTVGMSQVHSLASSGQNIAVSGVYRTQLHHLALKQFGTNTRPLSTGLGAGGINAEELGDGDRVVIGPSGRLWWNLRSNFPVLSGFPYLLVSQ